MLRTLVLLLACFSIHTSALFAQEASRPNIVFILADDLGYSDLGCYGSEIDTPQLDALASNGLRFTQFYNTSRCWPTRAALLTGYYAQQVRRDKLPGIQSGGVGTRPKWARLLPDFLKDAGYLSYQSGKWHIDGNLRDAGFDRSLNISNPGNMFTLRGTTRDDIALPKSETSKETYVTIATADHAIECLQEHAKSHSDSPFFQYIAFHAPHFPLHALPEDIAKYKDRYLNGWDELRKSRHAKQTKIGLINTPYAPIEQGVGPPYRYPDAFKKLGDGEVEFPLPWSSLTPQQQQFQATKMAIHAAMVDRMDQEIGRVVEQLKLMGVYENTIIFFASDNGASAEIMVRDGGHDPLATPGSAKTYLSLGPGFSSAANTPFRRHKTWVHEGGIATPLIVHWPAGIQTRGELRHTPAHMIDFVPTVLDLLDLDKPTQWDGEDIPEAPGCSIAPAFAKESTIERDFLWWSHEGNRALRHLDWKLVAVKDAPWELYDLKNDRAEQNNLADKMPEKVRELETLWLQQESQAIQLATPKAD